MADLHEALSDRRDEILLRWRAIVQGTILPESMPMLELVNHLPIYLREVIAALRADAGLPTTTLSPEDSPTAAGHGEQRLRLGFSLDAVVREYGALRDAIFQTARDAGVQITVRESQSVFDSTISGIAHAVSEYSRQRDAELNRQHNEHVAFIAHELRNPLASATMAFHLLREKKQLPDSRAVSALENGLLRMHELIDHSLQIARVASGIELRREPTSLKAFLEEVELVAAAEADSGNITLHVHVQDVTILIDRRLMRSAVNNLVRNAVKYTHAGSTVEIRGGIAGDRVKIEVEDACGGLPEGKVEEAFAPFVRMNTAVSGFGLGLAIAKQAVDAHAGTIRVQNLPGKGCIFVLELPITDAIL